MSFWHCHSGIVCTDNSNIDRKISMNIPLVGWLILTPIVFGGLSLVTYGYGTGPNYKLLLAPIIIVIEITGVITGVIPT
jgi:hypothetical protein